MASVLVRKYGRLVRDVLAQFIEELGDDHVTPCASFYADTRRSAGS